MKGEYYSCIYPTCSSKTTGGFYCDKHKQSQSNQEVLQRRSDESGTELSFYTNARWRRLRKWKLADTTLCEQCSRVAQEVDHIQPIRDGGDPYAIDNLQSLCKSCHSKKTVQDIKKRYNSSYKG
jgi:5-methylcytosine-specific restriction endonuclease McrA